MAEASLTKRALAQALKELLAQEPFEKVSVSAVCARAGVNRKSFYYHFKDKYDLVVWIFRTEFADDFAAAVRAGSDVDGWAAIAAACAYFDENRAFYRSVMAFEGQNSFREHFRASAALFVATRLDSVLPDLELERPSWYAFFTGFYTDVLVGATLRWVMTDDPLPVEEFVALLKLALSAIPVRAAGSGSMQARSLFEVLAVEGGEVACAFEDAPPAPADGAAQGTDGAQCPNLGH